MAIAYITMEQKPKIMKKVLMDTQNNYDYPIISTKWAPTYGKRSSDSSKLVSRKNSRHFFLECALVLLGLLIFCGLGYLFLW